MPDPTLSIHYTTFIYGAAMTIKGRWQVSMSNVKLKPFSGENF